MKRLNNNLDEMQELNMLHIEKRGFWIAYFGLALAIIIQCFMYHEDSIKYTAGELIILCVGGIYTTAAGIKKGMWSRRIPATHMSNLIQSIAYSGFFSIILIIAKYVKYGYWQGAIFAGVIFFFCIFIICEIVLSLMMVFYRKKRQKLEELDEDE